MNCTAFADAALAATRTYDADNRLLTESYGGTVELTNTYDAAGQLGLRATSAHGTQTVSYTYDKRNELYTVADSAGTSTYGYTSGGQYILGYDGDGNEDQQTLANGARVGKLFDADSALTEVNNVLPNGTTTASQFLYAYDADGRKSSGSDNTTSPPSSLAWSYDGQSHLASDTRTNGYAPYHDGYLLDGVGNRLTLTNIYGTFTFGYDADDELTSYNNSAYTFGYNANGDMNSSTLNGHLSTLTYDYDDQLTKIASQAGTVTYEYDALGRRIYRLDTSGVGHTFVFDGSNLVAEYNNATGVWDTQYTWGYDMLDKQGGADGTEFPLYDGLGDVYQSLNSGGSYILSKDIFDDYGQNFGSVSGTEDLSYQWRASSGYRTDGDGLWQGSYNEPLVEVGARYYLVSMGVFITRDKNLGQRPYEYCNADPVNNVDPTGSKPKTTVTWTVNPDGTLTSTSTTVYDDGSWSVTEITYNVDNTPVSLTEASSDGSWTTSDLHDIFSQESNIGGWEITLGGGGSVLNNALYPGLVFAPTDPVTLIPGLRYVAYGLTIGGVISKIIGSIGSWLTR